MALVQAALWIVSYLLYLVYTTAQIVYGILPGVLSAERRYTSQYWSWRSRQHWPA